MSSRTSPSWAAKVYVKRLHDVKSETSVYTLDGKPAGHHRLRRHRLRLRRLSAAPPIATASSASSPTFSRPPSIASTRSPANARSSPSPKSPSTPPVRTQAGLLQIKGRHPDSHVHRRQKRPEAGWIERLLMTGYGGFNLSETPDVESRLGLVAPAGRMVRRAQPARRRRVWRELARAGHVREKAERLRRLVRRRPVPDRQQVHLAAALRHHRPLQRRPADGRLLHPASRAVLRRLVRLSAARHAALSEVRARARTGPPSTAPPRTRSSSPTCSSTRLTRTSSRAPPIPPSCSSPATATRASTRCTPAK